MPEIEVPWKEHCEIAKSLNLSSNVVDNVVKLLDEGNEVVFIARYRREQTESMEAEKIREVKSRCEELR